MIFTPFLKSSKINICTNFVFVIFAFIFSHATQANSFDDEWKAFKQAEMQSFNDYRTEHDKAFTQFLERHWEEFNLFQGKTRDVTPKPPKAPAVKNWLASAYNKIQEAIFDKQSITATSRIDNGIFYGHKVQAISFHNVEFPRLSSPSNKKLADVWKKLSSLDHKKTIQKLEHARTQLALGDWAFFIYVYEQLKLQFPEKNQSTAYMWFLFNKMNYDLKVAYDRSQLYLLFPSHQTIYGKSYVEIEQTTYYMLDKKGDSSPLLSYPGKYNPNNNSLNVDFAKIIKASGQIKSRTLTYRDGEDKIKISLNFDSGHSKLLNQYPQTDLVHYFRAQPDTTVINSLRQQLKDKLIGLDEREAIDYLLKLTQTGFVYAKDQAQFGNENYLLTEESLLYQANDCEDRSIFLAWLIRDLLHLNVVGLDFPGHVALAVEIKPRESDWSITSKGKTFVMADPTYIGADIGMVMPSVANETATVIHF